MGLSYSKDDDYPDYNLRNLRNYNLYENGNKKICMIGESHFDGLLEEEQKDYMEALKIFNEDDILKKITLIIENGTNLFLVKPGGYTYGVHSSPGIIQSLGNDYKSVIKCDEIRYNPLLKYPEDLFYDIYLKQPENKEKSLIGMQLTQLEREINEMKKDESTPGDISHFYVDILFLRLDIYAAYFSAINPNTDYISVLNSIDEKTKKMIKYLKFAELTVDINTTREIFMKQLRDQCDIIRNKFNNNGITVDNLIEVYKEEVVQIVYTLFHSLEYQNKIYINYLKEYAKSPKLIEIIEKRYKKITDHVLFNINNFIVQTGNKFNLAELTKECVSCDEDLKKESTLICMPLDISVICEIIEQDGDKLILVGYYHTKALNNLILLMNYKLYKDYSKQKDEYSSGFASAKRTIRNFYNFANPITPQLDKVFTGGNPINLWYLIAIVIVVLLIIIYYVSVNGSNQRKNNYYQSDRYLTRMCE